MLKSRLTIVAATIALLTPLAATAQPTNTLPGIWIADDGTSTVRIAPCPSSTLLCGTVIDERLKSGETSYLNQIVVRDIKPSGKQWSAKFVGDGASFNAKVKQIGADRMAFKICAFAFLCDTQTFVRVRK